MKARSINFFLLDGDPSGIWVAQISMSTIRAIAFRRNQVRRVREVFPEIERLRVHILIGSARPANLDDHVWAVTPSRQAGPDSAYLRAAEGRLVGCEVAVRGVGGALRFDSVASGERG